ncbi:MAG: hypothetical protein U1A22_13525 [Xanthomonadaceae bacterium]|nr:hypothetical protein [Xanthomonadaceae bacterium]
MELYQVAVITHIGAGSVALLTFWAAAWLKKGSPLHRRFGQIYLLAMLTVILSGVPLVLVLQERGHPVTALFLGYLLVLVSNSCLTAFRAIRLKQQPARYFSALFWIVHGLTATSGLAVMAVGWSTGATLLMVFGSIGLFGLWGGIRAWRRAPTHANWWLREHYGAMIGNGVATHIAFFGIGLRSLLPGIDPGLLTTFAWFGPLAAALLAGVWLDRTYGRRSAARPVRTTASRA